MASIKTYSTKQGRRYLVRYRDARNKEQAKAFNRRKDADKFKADVERRKQLGPLWEAPTETVGVFLDAWLERYRLRVRESSYQRRVEALRVLPDSLRARTLTTLTAADVEDAVHAIAARAPRQAQLTLATVKLALRDARRRGHRIDEGILETPTPRVVRRKPRFLTWEEVERLASWMDDDSNRLVRFAALTGARQGELFALRWSDVDLEDGHMTIGESKTDAGRRNVDLPAAAVDILRGLDCGGAATLVFPAAHGGERQPNNFMERTFRPARKHAGLPGVTFHDLRHTCASLMIAAGCNVKQIAAQLGHADGGALVLKRYGHLYPGATRDAANMLDDLVAQTRKVAV